MLHPNLPYLRLSYRVLVVAVDIAVILQVVFVIKLIKLNIVAK